MEKYPVPTKCRLAAADDAEGDKQENKESSPTVSSTTQLRSKLRPPSVTLARPLSIPSNRAPIDTNGNIPRPSSLPRLLKNDAAPQEVKPVTSRVTPPRTASLDSKNRSIDKDNAKTSSPLSKDSQIGSVSPSVSTLSVASSLGSNKSNSVADSGIASSSQRSPTLAEKKSALSLKFGFYSQRKPTGVAEMKKAAVDRFNSAAAQGKEAVVRTATIAAPVYPKSRVQKIGAPRPTYRLPPRQMSAETTTKVLPMPQLALIKDRAAQVLARSRSTDYKPIEMRPRLSVEAIVASLEQEVRHQLGPELPPLPPIDRAEEDEKRREENIDIEQQLQRHLLQPDKAEVAYVESDEHDEEDLIEDIELQLQTPSSAADHQASP